VPSVHASTISSSRSVPRPRSSLALACAIATELGCSSTASVTLSCRSRWIIGNGDRFANWATAKGGPRVSKPDRREWLWVAVGGCGWLWVAVGGSVAAHVAGVALFLVHKLVRRVEAHELEVVDQALVLHPRLGVLRVLCEGKEVVGEDVRVHEERRLDLGVGLEQVNLVEEGGAQALGLTRVRDSVPQPARVAHRLGPWAEAQSDHHGVDPSATGLDRAALGRRLCLPSGQASTHHHHGQPGLEATL
jgi:hypothetical protein